MIQGRLLCGACTPPDRFIGLGMVPEVTQEFRDPSGKLIKTVTFPSESASIPSVLRDVVGREGGMFKLSCNHYTHGFMVSSQEWVILNGGRIEGKSLVGAFA